MRFSRVLGLRADSRISGIDCEIFAGSVADPTTEAVDQGLRAFVEGKHDSLVSLGGGSSIDTAKAIGLLVANGGRIGDYEVPNRYLHRALPMLRYLLRLELVRK